MRILIAISVLVLVAILWSAIAIVRHIRRGRRRNAQIHRRSNAEQVKALRNSSLSPLPARFAAPVLEPVLAPVTIAALPTEIPQEHVTESFPNPQSEPIVVAQTQKSDPTVSPVIPVKLIPAPALRIEPTEASAAPAASEVQAHPPLRILEVPGTAGLRTRPAFQSLQPRQDAPHPASPPAIAPPPPADPNLRRPVRSVHLQPEGAKPSHRPDWIYFNKDMGDLSDPAPSRVRVRGH